MSLMSGDVLRHSPCSPAEIFRRSIMAKALQATLCGTYQTSAQAGLIQWAVESDAQ